MKENIEGSCETSYFHSINKKFEWRFIKKDEEKNLLFMETFSVDSMQHQFAIKAGKAWKTSWTWKSFVFLVQFEIHSNWKIFRRNFKRKSFFFLLNILSQYSYFHGKWFCRKTLKWNRFSTTLLQILETFGTCANRERNVFGEIKAN